MRNHDKTTGAPAVVPCGDRKRWILDLVDGMRRGDAASAIFDDHPLPLLEWLAGVRFGEFSASYEPRPPGRWIVKLRKR